VAVNTGLELPFIKCNLRQMASESLQCQQLQTQWYGLIRATETRDTSSFADARMLTGSFFNVSYRRGGWVVIATNDFER